MKKQTIILNLIKENPHITRREIAAQLEMSEDGARYHLRKMTEAGIIRYVGTSRNGYWEHS